tara:strand:+ start:519 stop:767 length:249 start_codon:yes stop_codon:yes gene_type:complete
MKLEVGNTYMPCFALDTSISEAKVRIDFELNPQRDHEASAKETCKGISSPTFIKEKLKFFSLILTSTKANNNSYPTGYLQSG